MEQAQTAQAQNEVVVAEHLDETAEFVVRGELIAFTQKWVNKFRPEVVKFFKDLTVKQMVDGAIGLARVGENPNTYYGSMMNVFLSGWWNPLQAELIEEAKEVLTENEQVCLNDLIGTINMMMLRPIESAWFAAHAEELETGHKEAFQALAGELHAGAEAANECGEECAHEGCGCEGKEPVALEKDDSVDENHVADPY